MSRTFIPFTLCLNTLPGQTEPGREEVVPQEAQERRCGWNNIYWQRDPLPWTVLCKRQKKVDEDHPLASPSLSSQMKCLFASSFHTSYKMPVVDSLHITWLFLWHFSCSFLYPYDDEMMMGNLLLLEDQDHTTTKHETELYTSNTRRRGRRGERRRRWTEEEANNFGNKTKAAAASKARHEEDHHHHQRRLVLQVISSFSLNHAILFLR